MEVLEWRQRSEWWREDLHAQDAPTRDPPHGTAGNERIHAGQLGTGCGWSAPSQKLKENGFRFFDFFLNFLNYSSFEHAIRKNWLFSLVSLQHWMCMK